MKSTTETKNSKKTKREMRDVNVNNNNTLKKYVLLAGLLSQQIKNKNARLSNLKETIKEVFENPTSEESLKFIASRITKSGKTQIATVVVTARSESQSLDLKKVMAYIETVNPDLSKEIVENQELYTTKKGAIEVKPDLTEI